MHKIDVSITIPNPVICPILKLNAKSLTRWTTWSLDLALNLRIGQMTGFGNGDCVMLRSSSVTSVLNDQEPWVTVVRKSVKPRFNNMQLQTTKVINKPRNHFLETTV